MRQGIVDAGARGAVPAVALLAALAGIAGCQPLCPVTSASLDQIVAEHNANASAVPTLWARAKIAVTVADDKGWTYTWGSTSPMAAPNGLLLLAKSDNPLGPHDFVLIGREVAGVEVFRIGASTRDGVYYMWYKFGDRHGGLFGRPEMAQAPRTAGAMIDPQQLLAVLNVTAMPEDRGSLPAVALSLQKAGPGGLFEPGEPCAYVVSHIDRQPVSGRVMFKRETLIAWGDKEPRRPFAMNFFEPDGRRTVAAEIRDYRPIAQTAVGSGQAVIPTDIILREVPWPGRTSRLKLIHVVLQDMTAKPTGKPAAAAALWDKLPFAPEDMTSLDQPSQGPGAP